MKYKIFHLYEYFPDEDAQGKYFDNKRIIFSFDNYNSAYEVMLCIEKNDALDTALGIEENEITT